MVSDMPLYVIAGHGAGDTGACGNGFQEAERVRALASRMGELGGEEIIVLDMGRNWFADRGILGLDLPPSSQIVELHMDSGPRGARGGHVIVKPGKQPDGYDLALAALLSGMFPGRAESIRGQSLGNATRAAQKGYGYRLLECGFITDELDVGTFNSHLDKLSLGIMGAFGIAPGTTKEDELIRIEIPRGTYPVYRAYRAETDDHFLTGRPSTTPCLPSTPARVWRSRERTAVPSCTASTTRTHCSTTTPWTTPRPRSGWTRDGKQRPSPSRAPARERRCFACTIRIPAATTGPPTLPSATCSWMRDGARRMRTGMRLVDWVSGWLRPWCGLTYIIWRIV